MASRKPNPDHPHNRLNRYLQVMHKARQCMTTEKVRELARHDCPARAIEIVGMVRHDLLKLLEECDRFDFKKAWEAKYGWPFDDVYDEAKFDAHIANEKAKNPVIEVAPPSDSLQGKVDAAIIKCATERSNRAQPDPQSAPATASATA